VAGDFLYVESSALIKLLREEAESEALQHALTSWPLRVSSIITAVELPRAVRRGIDCPAGAARAEALIEPLDLIPLDRTVADAAAALAPAALRSLDAIHLASALSLGGELGVLATYDRRLAEAARAAGLGVLAPG
jgi:predicted nucleic acid-binding protein